MSTRFEPRLPEKSIDVGQNFDSLSLSPRLPPKIQNLAACWASTARACGRCATRTSPTTRPWTTSSATWARSSENLFGASGASSTFNQLEQELLDQDGSEIFKQELRNLLSPPQDVDAQSGNGTEPTPERFVDELADGEITPDMIPDDVKQTKSYQESLQVRRIGTQEFRRKRSRDRAALSSTAYSGIHQQQNV